MRALLVLICSLLLSVGTLWAEMKAPERPQPSRLVNDLAGVMAAGEQQALERKLRAYMDSTTTQIVVVTIPTADGTPMSNLALDILQGWGVGQDDKDNGAVILVAVNDRKVRIETGYGMEGVLPDAKAGRIISQLMLPSFKQQKYYEGLNKATDAIIQAAEGEYSGSMGQAELSDETVMMILLGFFVFIIFLFIVIRRATKNLRPNGTIMSRRGYRRWDDTPTSGGWWIGTGPTFGGGGWGSSGDSDSGGGGGFDFGGGDGGGGGAEGGW